MVEAFYLIISIIIIVLLIFGFVFMYAKNQKDKKEGDNTPSEVDLEKCMNCNNPFCNKRKEGNK